MMSLVYFSSVVMVTSCFLFLSTYTATTAYAFHGNATEDALLESPGASSTTTGLVCDSGTDNEAVLNITKTSRTRLNFQCITDHTIVFSFEEEDSMWGWSSIELLKTRANYTLEEIATSGLGSVGNPTRFYVVMSK